MGPTALEDWNWARRAVAALLARLQAMLARGQVL